MKSVTSYLQDLVRIPSVSSLSNRDVIEYAHTIFAEAHWNTVVDSYVDASGTEKLNLIAAPPGQSAEEPAADLAILCHTDTVPPAADWPEAFEPRIADGLLHGCGACDVKGFLACLFVAATQTPTRSIRPGLRIVLTADEEVGCIGSYHLRDAEKLRPRLLLIGEPTSLHAARAGKGYCLAELTIFGAEAHSAHPHHGRSAIYDAARFIHSVEQFSEQLAQERNLFFEPPYTTINIGTIAGGTAKNVVPAECRLLIEWRPVPRGAPARVPGGLQQILDTMTEKDRTFRYKLTILRQQNGFETSSDATLVRAIEALTGRPSIAIPFGSEASVFASMAEQVVVFGPGDMRFAHSPRECVPLAELDEAVHCLTALIQAGSATTANDVVS